MHLNASACFSSARLIVPLHAARVTACMPPGCALQSGMGRVSAPFSVWKALMVDFLVNHVDHDGNSARMTAEFVAYKDL